MKFMRKLVAMATLGGLGMALWRRLFGGSEPALSADDLPAPCADHESIVADLKDSIGELAGEIGERHVHSEMSSLRRAADFIEERLTDHGFEVERQKYSAGGEEVENLIVELEGEKRPEEIVVVGAHYDTIPGSPGANDNGTGVASTLLLACMFREMQLDRSIRFVFFVNEEPPFFQTDEMGSFVYAERCRERGDEIIAMICLETIGYYSDERGSQKYPGPLDPLLPSTGNFLAFVSNLHHRKLVRRAVDVFRGYATIPAESGAFPGYIPGVGWSDHWSFWEFDYPALMVTDTAPFRYPYYHTAEDTPDKIDYDRTARAIDGLRAVVRDFCFGD